MRFLALSRGRTARRAAGGLVVAASMGMLATALAGPASATTGRTAPGRPGPATPGPGGRVAAAPATVARSRPAAPAKPEVGIYLPSPTAQLYGADERASLRIENVVAGSGQVASITVRYGRHKVRALPVNGDATSYETVIEGLTNGRKYSFTATVCNTAHRCTTSDPRVFTPYGVPEVPTVTATVSGTEVNLVWGTVERNFSPFNPTGCRVIASGDPADPDAPTVGVSPDEPGESSFTGVSGTTYTIHYRCSLAGRVLDSASDPVTVP